MTEATDAAQAAMAGDGFDALLVVAPPNIAYLSGFHATPHERLIALVVPREGPLRLVAPSLEEEAARAAVPEGTRLFVWRDEEGPDSALAAALADGGGTVGIEKTALTVATHELAAACLPWARFGDCDPLLRRLRAVKRKDELERHRAAARIADRAVERLVAEELRPGRTEAELAAACARILREEGGETVFEPIVLAGPNSALPHGRSGGHAVVEGELVIVDIGATFGGYWADITRTFVLGEPSERQLDLYAVVREAYEAGVRAVAAGAPCADVDRAARGVIEAAGFGAAFVHRTGHGLGLDVHEPPYLTGRNEEPLEAGMVVTVEPGVYLPGFGGVRIEDDIAVGAGGAEVLTKAPIRLEPA